MLGFHAVMHTFLLQCVHAHVLALHVYGMHMNKGAKGQVYHTSVWSYCYLHGNSVRTIVHVWARMKINEFCTSFRHYDAHAYMDLSHSGCMVFGMH